MIILPFKNFQQTAPLGVNWICSQLLVVQVFGSEGAFSSQAHCFFSDSQPPDETTVYIWTHDANTSVGGWVELIILCPWE